MTIRTDMRAPFAVTVVGAFSAGRRLRVWPDASDRERRTVAHTRHRLLLGS